MLYVADALSLLRIILTPFVVFFGLTGRWEAAFVCLITAWFTDLCDGKMARNFGSLRDKYPSFDADGIADSVLAFVSSAVPVIYYGTHVGWCSGPTVALIILYILTIVSGVWMITVIGAKLKTLPKKWVARINTRIVAVNMIVMHGIVQIGATIGWFAYMAGGDKIAVYAGSVLLLAAYGQDHKIRLWRAGRLA
jgi:phosphatidylglycerophosphate synthase